MSATTLAEKGMAAIQSKNWVDAITHLSAAIAQSKSPQWLLSRSQAYMESGDLLKALRDAEYAYCTAVERGNDKSRKQMIEAQHRRSVVYFRLKQHANADVCAVWAMELAKGTAIRIADHTADKIDANGFYHTTEDDLVEPGTAAGDQAKDSSRFAQISSLMGAPDSEKKPYEKEFQREQFWRANINRYLEALAADDPARKVTAKLTPVKPSLDDKVEKKHNEIDPEIEAAKAAAKVPVVKPEPSNGPFRNAFYQSDGSCTATLFMKFANKEEVEKVVIDIQPNLVHFIPAPCSSQHPLTSSTQITITNVPRDPSIAYIIPHAAIDPAKSTYRVITMKIELTLAKAQPGKWPGFGREELSQPDPSTLPVVTTAPAPSAPVTSEASTTAKAPAYPTSSRSGPKDWEHIDDDADEEKDGNVDDFFKKLYAGATPDQQRAMMKSFQESNGTTLSTDWNDIGNRTVPTDPPKGVEAKKWNS